MHESLKLLGIVIVVVGLALRLRPTLVVVAAALVTGWLAGLPLYLPEVDPRTLAPGTRPPEGLLNMLGRAFAENRLMTLFILTLPAIGLSERYGLQERAAALILRARGATVGRLLLGYQFFRVGVGALGIRLNGHPSFIRPLVFPMSLGAANASAGDSGSGTVPAERVETIKAANAAAENYGNFYGQNLSPVNPGVLLVFGVLQGLGYRAGVWSMIRYTTVIVLLSLVLGAIQFRLLDRRGRS
ncbi:5-oxoproline transporter, DUF969 family subunit [Archangium sp.]|uniref:5-oxoproline transporter, DUF969 family subunit n=1 Tax=Archangium sp. TaxID=1872627 RepID=UPI002D5C107D|nr:DUF969 family protein [Archangium sp.]HYO52016.1 DUF969 family protein [Archangium sp.]